MNKLKKIIISVLNVSENDVTDEMTIKNTVNWDSLKHMELIITIEESYNLKLTTNEIAEMTNLKNIKRVLKKKGIKTQ